MAALVVLLPLSLAIAGGVPAWRSFVDNATANLRSTGTNTVGLMSVLSYEHGNRREVLVDPDLDDPDRIWLEAKRSVFERRRPLFWVLVAGFVVYRLFDICKPWPIRLLEEGLGLGGGIVADDIVAGLYTLAVLHAARWVLERLG